MKQSCRGVGRVAQNARVRNGELVGVADAQAALVRARYTGRARRVPLLGSISIPNFGFQMSVSMKPPTARALELYLLP